MVTVVFNMTTAASVTEDIISTSNISLLSTTDISTRSLLETTTSLNTTIIQSTEVLAADEDNSTTVIAISIPLTILALIGTALVILVLFRSKLLRHLYTDEGSKNGVRTTKFNHIKGQTNKTFDGQMEAIGMNATEKDDPGKVVSNIEQRYSSKEEYDIVDECKPGLRMTFLSEDNYGYGQFKSKTGIKSEVNDVSVYQNSLATDITVKEEDTQTTGIYSNLNGSLEVYTNVDIEPELVLSKPLRTDQESTSITTVNKCKSDKTITNDDVLKSQENEEYYNMENDTSEANSTNNIYENTDLNNPGAPKEHTPICTDKSADKRKLSYTNIPFYLELEDDANNINVEQLEGVIERPVYDYAAVINPADVPNDTHDKQDVIDDDIEEENHYYILEKECTNDECKDC